ncbi:MAG: hypothetical protein WD824_02865 [Cyclobacteriaceae bacterium]
MERLNPYSLFSQEMEITKIKSPTEATEASGIVCRENELLIVSDEVPGVYFSFNISGHRGKVITLSNGERKTLFKSSLAIDFEAIDFLADERIVALSERLRSLIGATGLIVQYDDQFSELGEKGLEGLAIRPLPAGNGGSKITVLWEGGWVEESEVQPQVFRGLTNQLRPVMLTHEHICNIVPVPIS